MLPNHSPLVIAEQFGTLACLYGPRIDLGLGRAPGSDQATMRALRRTSLSAESFPQDVRELRSLLAPAHDGQDIKAIPGEGTQVPLWILGSSHFGAALAAELGLPYAFASHFAPEQLLPALRIYRSRFKPSEQLSQPYAMVGVNVIAADTEREARRLATTQQMSFVNLIRGRAGLSPEPIEDMDRYWSPMERAHVDAMLSCSIVGTTADIHAKSAQLLAQTGADELMVVSDIFDHQSRIHSLKLTASALL